MNTITDGGWMKLCSLTEIEMNVKRKEKHLGNLLFLVCIYHCAVVLIRCLVILILISNVWTLLYAIIYSIDVCLVYFQLYPGLNGERGTVSLQSVAFPKFFLHSDEGSVGLEEYDQIVTDTFKNQATFFLYEEVNSFFFHFYNSY